MAPCLLLLPSTMSLFSLVANINLPLLLLAILVFQFVDMSWASFFSFSNRALKASNLSRGVMFVNFNLNPDLISLGIKLASVILYSFVNTPSLNITSAFAVPCFPSKYCIIHLALLMTAK